MVGLVAAVALSTAPSAFVLTNARIWTGTGEPIAQGGVRVRAGRIEAVGADVGPQSGYQTVDLAGATVYPGFIDGFTRAGIKLPDAPKPPEPRDASQDALYTMATKVRGMEPGLNASALFDPAQADARLLAQGVTTLHVASRRGLLGGASGLVNAAKEANARVVRPRVAQTVAFVGVPGPGYPTSPMGRIAVVRQAFRDAFGGDQELAPLAVAGAPVAVTAGTEREIDRALDLAEEFNLNLILVGAREAWRDADRIKARNVRVIIDLALPDEPRREPAKDPVERLSEAPLSVLQDRWERWRAQADYAKRLAEAGVPFAFAGDGAGTRFFELVRQHVEFGLPKEAALRALTVDAAALLGASGQVGTIQPGAWANLVVFREDPFGKDVKPTAVYVAGEAVEVKG